nr:peptidase [uncultured Clostridium sp.]
MKLTLALISTALLLCTVLAPCVLAAEEPAISAETKITDTVTGSGSVADGDDSIDTATPSDAGTVTVGDETTGTDDSPARADGTGDGAVPDSFDYTGSVISYTTPDAFTSTFDMVCGDSSFTQLHHALDSVSISGTAEKDGSFSPLTLPITWNFSAVDAETPGNYTAIGNISIPDGTTLAVGLENSVSISIQVTAPMLSVSPSAITLTSFDEPGRTDAVAFAVGTTQEELTDWFSSSVMGFSGYDVEGNYYDLISGEWNLDAVNTASAGVYYAWTSPDLGTEYTLADGFSLPRQLCAVSIQVPGEPDINCCVAGRGFLHFPWVLSATQEEQVDEFAVWLRQNGGEWTSLSDGFLFVSDGLQLSQQVLTYRSTYELKVTYPGGETGVLTFQYNGELSIIDYSGGDRDGGDVNGGGSGTGTQPAPTNPQTPDHSNENDNQNGGNSGEIYPTPTTPQIPDTSKNDGNDGSNNNTPIQAPVSVKPDPGTPAAGAESAIPVFSFFSKEAESISSAQENDAVPQPKDNVQVVINPIHDSNKTPLEKSSTPQESAAVTESYSPTQTIISGLRLKDLCKEEERVVFGSGDLTVSIPSKLLLSLNLSDTDTLTVRLTQPKRNQIALAVEVSGKSVTLLSGTVLRLRYIPQSENTDITVRGDAGEQITEISYDEELLRIAADAAGTYTIMEQFSTQETRKSTSPLLPITGGLIITAGGITFFRRKRHG